MTELNNKLLIRYLTDNCTKKERQCIEKWKQNNTQNRELLEQYENLWKKAAMDSNHPKKKFNTKKGWKLLQKEIKKEAAPSTESKDIPYRAFKKRNFKYRLISAAAIFLAVTLIGFLAYQSWNPGEPPERKSQMQEIVTDIGQRTHITLSDGTTILLNADSKLRVPNIFKKNVRKVYLQGEAFFEVAENPDKPFVIYVEGTIVRVLGTAFSVSAYPEDHQVSVVVKHGRVRFKANNEPEAPSTVITTSELATYSEKDKTITAKQVRQLDLYLGWINGSLNFKKTSMTKVATDLERRYGVKVVFKNPEIKNMVLTAHLKSKMIQNVLDVIAISLKINYKLINDKVVFLLKIRNDAK